MNKLRKAPPPPLLLTPKIQQVQQTSSPSRTMMYAQTVAATSSPPKPTSVAVASQSATVVRAADRMAAMGNLPTSRGEQYWAGRALTAETFLTVNALYQQELTVLNEARETKHSQEMAALNHQHETRHSKLERFAMLLFSWLIALVAVLIYLLLRGHPPQVSSRWTPPLHFTIPVLSPFTSVTEHETSVLSTRTIAVMILALSCLAYACFTYWLKLRKR